MEDSFVKMFAKKGEKNSCCRKMSQKEYKLYKTNKKEKWKLCNLPVSKKK